MEKIKNLLVASVMGMGFENVNEGKFSLDYLGEYYKAKLGPMGVIGIRKDSSEYFYNLVDIVFAENPKYNRGIRFDSLLSIVLDVMIDMFYGNMVDNIDHIVVKDFLRKIDDVVSGEISKHKIYVPCQISPCIDPDFKIGAIEFLRQESFSNRERENIGDRFDKEFCEILEEMTLCCAGWMAIVEVENCAKERAWEIGELAVDIALAGLQLVIPLNYSEYMARMSARKAPIVQRRVSRMGDLTSRQVDYHVAGAAMGPGALAYFLNEGQDCLQAVGQRVNSFLTGTSIFPNLGQAWADSAYWFHEGLAEPLDTIAIPKLETAIEVLLRAENSSGSKARLLHAIRSFYGRDRCDFINPDSQITVERFAADFVMERSRILHGTWSTLSHSMRDSRRSLTDLVQGLLTGYVLKLNEYESCAGTLDNTNAFLNWVDSQRQPNTAKYGGA